MKERLWDVLAWAAFVSLLFGVIPLVSLAIGYQLEEIQTKPSFETFTCEEIEAPNSRYQNLLQQYETLLEMEKSQSSVVIEKFGREQCRIAGSGTAIQWVRGTEVGFIYANLSEARVYERLGYRTFFHDISSARYEWTTLFALPWLPIVLLLYVTTGNLRILPWKQTANHD